MRIPPFSFCGGGPPGDGFSRLMAEYAARDRCVQLAAGGFLPARRIAMPRKKQSRRRVFLYFMADDAPKRQTESAAAKQKIPRGKQIQCAPWFRIDGFCGKNGRKQGELPKIFFAVAFARRLVYCSMRWLKEAFIFSERSFYFFIYSPPFFRRGQVKSKENTR